VARADADARAVDAGDGAPDPEQAVTGEVATADAPVLSTRNLTIRFGGHVAVDHVNLDVPPRALKSIIGPNGAGKTTLFNLLSGQYRATEGRIALKGADVTGWSAARRTRAGIGRSFQLTNIFPTLSVLENVRIALQARAGIFFNAWRSYRAYPALEDRAWEVLETVLLDAKWRAPAGELAHGEKRKLEVGILVALDAEVLLLDEPTAGMSLEEVPSIIALIEGIRRRRDRTVLLVEHKIDMIMALSDSIAVLKDGRLIADDTPEAISQNKEVQAAYFGGGVR
jgi:branched-chain amino acid transport system ATP-binding protein